MHFKYGDKLVIRILSYSHGRVIRFQHGFRFRIDPVPNVSCYHNQGRPIMRCMRTTQERRMIFSCDLKYIRGKRSYRSLPNPWDEYVISDNYYHGWKRSKKKKQWM